MLLCSNTLFIPIVTVHTGFTFSMCTYTIYKKILYKNYLSQKVQKYFLIYLISTFIVLLEILTKADATGVVCSTGMSD